METKFTKGPWSVGRYVKTEVIAYKSVMGSSFVSVAVPYNASSGPVLDDCEQRANAHLIAAAPELYEALLACVEGEFACTDKAAVELAEAALAKARGESQ